ncbi:hypothetical protein J2Z69_002382 [Paenibacillus shirakamiensis]|uniref:Stress-response A/B barrel domain-containing protein n=1 Tax=Paenibacillus shirakamiensis TaxID=1265935 RepID=A0ABS4JHY8_9BACL|nr:Dabb family protein [Paenibacillus shirakamiensis]MBP2001339.1 hypothetical protein [Paenibacillus shirakamiensis]
MIKHIVLFKLKDASTAIVDRTLEVLRELDGKVEQLVDIQVGADIIHSARSYDIALVATFASQEDLNGYQVHPEHLKVIEYMNEVRESSIAVDYEF